MKKKKYNPQADSLMMSIIDRAVKEYTCNLINIQGLKIADYGADKAALAKSPPDKIGMSVL